jgi:hypothetical protein
VDDHHLGRHVGLSIDSNRSADLVRSDSADPAPSGARLPDVIRRHHGRRCRVSEVMEVIPEAARQRWELYLAGEVGTLNPPEYLSEVEAAAWRHAIEKARPDAS